MVIAAGWHQENTAKSFDPNEVITIDVDPNGNPNYLLDLTNGTGDLEKERFNLIYIENINPVPDIKSLVKNALTLLDDNGVLIFCGAGANEAYKAAESLGYQLTSLSSDFSKRHFIATKGRTSLDKTFKELPCALRSHLIERLIRLGIYPHQDKIKYIDVEIFNICQPNNASEGWQAFYKQLSANIKNYENMIKQSNEENHHKSSLHLNMLRLVQLYIYRAEKVLNQPEPSQENYIFALTDYLKALELHLKIIPYSFSWCTTLKLAEEVINCYLALDQKQPANECFDSLIDIINKNADPFGIENKHSCANSDPQNYLPILINISKELGRDDDASLYESELNMFRVYSICFRILEGKNFFCPTEKQNDSKEVDPRFMDKLFTDGVTIADILAKQSGAADRSDEEEDNEDLAKIQPWKTDELHSFIERHTNSLLVKLEQYKCSQPTKIKSNILNTLKTFQIICEHVPDLADDNERLKVIISRLEEEINSAVEASKAASIWQTENDGTAKNNTTIDVSSKRKQTHDSQVDIEQTDTKKQKVNNNEDIKSYKDLNSAGIRFSFAGNSANKEEDTNQVSQVNSVKQNTKQPARLFSTAIPPSILNMIEDIRKKHQQGNTK